MLKINAMPPIRVADELSHHDEEVVGAVHDQHRPGCGARAKTRGS